MTNTIKKLGLRRTAQLCNFSPRETQLFIILGAAQGLALSQEQLCEIMYFNDYRGGPETIKIVDCMVCKMRRKLRELEAGWRIVNEFGRGYRLERLS